MAQTIVDTWSSSVLAKIFVIDGVAVGSTRIQPHFYDSVFRQINPAPQIRTLGVNHRLHEDIERV